MIGSGIANYICNETSDEDAIAMSIIGIPGFLFFYIPLYLGWIHTIQWRVFFVCFAGGLMMVGLLGLFALLDNFLTRKWRSWRGG